MDFRAIEDRGLWNQKGGYSTFVIIEICSGSKDFAAVGYLTILALKMLYGFPL